MIIFMFVFTLMSLENSPIFLCHHSSGMNSILPDFMCASNFRMRPPLETSSLQMKVVKMMLFWVRVGPKCNDSCPSEKRGPGIRGGVLCHSGAGMGVVQLQAQSTPHLVPATEPGRSQGCSLEPSKGTRPRRPLDFRILAWEN